MFVTSPSMRGLTEDQIAQDFQEESKEQNVLASSHRSTGFSFFPSNSAVSFDDPTESKILSARKENAKEKRHPFDNKFEDMELDKVSRTSGYSGYEKKSTKIETPGFKTHTRTFTFVNGKD